MTREEKKAYKKAWDESNKDKLKAYAEKHKYKKKFTDRSRYTKNREKIIEQVKARYQIKKEEIKNKMKLWYEHSRAERLEQKKSYYKLNKYKYLAQNTKRKATQIQATPHWLTEDHLDKMKEIYKQCHKGYHVDHIIPLKGKEVCGLHVPWNLQILTAEENIKKGNRVDATAQAFAFLNNNV